MRFFTKSNIFYSLITLVILAAVSISFIQITTNDTRKETEEQMRDLSNQRIRSEEHTSELQSRI